MNDGYLWIVDIDLEKFFDTVPQDKLMSLVHNIINDPDTESLIRKFIQAGIMDKGKFIPSETGTPQGGLCLAQHNPPYDELIIMLLMFG